MPERPPLERSGPLPYWAERQLTVRDLQRVWDRYDRARRRARQVDNVVGWALVAGVLSTSSIIWAYAVHLLLLVI